MKLWDKDKFEVTLRIGIMCVCGFSLSIASMPNVVPPSQALTPGLITAMLSQILPKLMFAVTIGPPVTLFLFVAIAGFSAMLLAAASVPRGLFIGIYSVCALLMTMVFFGKMCSFTISFANVYISIIGLMGLSHLPAVEEGGLSAVADMWKEQGVPCFVSTRMCVFIQHYLFVTHMMLTLLLLTSPRHHKRRCRMVKFSYRRMLGSSIFWGRCSHPTLADFSLLY